jgi:hypothetical protein
MARKNATGQRGIVLSKNTIIFVANTRLCATLSFLHKKRTVLDFTFLSQYKCTKIAATAGDCRLSSRRAVSQSTAPVSNPERNGTKKEANR